MKIKIAFSDVIPVLIKVRIIRMPLLSLLLVVGFGNLCYGQANYTDYKCFYENFSNAHNASTRILTNRLLAMKSGEGYIKKWEALYRQAEEIRKNARKDAEELKQKYGTGMSDEARRVRREFQSAVSKRKSLKKQHDRVEALLIVAKTSLNLCQGLQNSNCSEQVSSVNRLRNRLANISSEGKQVSNRARRLQPEYERYKAEYNRARKEADAASREREAFYERKMASITAELSAIRGKILALTTIWSKENEETKPLTISYTKKITGTWRMIEKIKGSQDIATACEKKMHYTFKEDGSYVINAPGDDSDKTCNNNPYKGKWHLQGTFLALGKKDGHPIGLEIGFADDQLYFYGNEALSRLTEVL